MERDTKKTYEKLMDKQSIAYLGSIDEKGFPEIRAMLAPRKRVGIETFYMTTNTSSKKIEQFRKNSKACLYFCDKRFYRGITLIGHIEVLEDEISKKMLWQLGDTMYYPKGVTDPDYCVLKFTAIKGEYYSNFKTREIIIEENN